MGLIWFTGNYRYQSFHLSNSNLRSEASQELRTKNRLFIYLKPPCSIQWYALNMYFKIPTSFSILLLSFGPLWLSLWSNQTSTTDNLDNEKWLCKLNMNKKKMCCLMIFKILTFRNAGKMHFFYYPLQSQCICSTCGHGCLLLES